MEHANSFGYVKFKRSRRNGGAKETERCKKRNVATLGLSAGGATEAIDALQSDPFDLALVSDRSSQMERLHKALQAKRIPVLLLKNESGDRWTADGAIPLPFRPSELFSAVEQTLKNKAKEQAGE